jgi:hypothetical protein
MCQLPRLYFFYKAIRWLWKGRKTDEASDRYGLVLGFTFLAIYLFFEIIAPVIVGFYFGKSSDMWTTPTILLVVNLLFVLYWRYVMIKYYEHKDRELAEELELEEFNLNKAPTISNVSVNENAALIGGSGQGNQSVLSKF